MYNPVHKVYDSICVAIEIEYYCTRINVDSSKTVPMTKITRLFIPGVLQVMLEWKIYENLDVIFSFLAGFIS